MAGLPWGQYVPTEVMWRCETCGKWSHALRRPLRHEVFVREDQPEPPSEAIIETVPGEHYGEEYKPGGWRVWCGPFEKWTAERVPASSQSARKQP